MKTHSITATAEVTYQIPMLPNFVRIRGQESAMSIADIDPKILQQIGDAWTKALIESAKRKRERK